MEGESDNSTFLFEDLLDEVELSENVDEINDNGFDRKPELREKVLELLQDSSLAFSSHSSKPSKDLFKYGMLAYNTSANKYILCRALPEGSQAARDSENKRRLRNLMVEAISSPDFRLTQFNNDIERTI